MTCVPSVALGTNHRAPTRGGAVAGTNGFFSFPCDKRNRRGQEPRGLACFGGSRPNGQQMATWRWRGTGRAGDLIFRRNALPTPFRRERLDSWGPDPLSLVADCPPCSRPARNKGFSMDGPFCGDPARRDNFEQSEPRWRVSHFHWLARSGASSPDLECSVWCGLGLQIAPVMITLSGWPYSTSHRMELPIY